MKGFLKHLRRKYSLMKLQEAEPPSLKGQVKSYQQVPGPRPIPFLGNTWRFIPLIGDFKIEDLHLVSKRLKAQYGNVVKISGLLGRPDMVFVYDPIEIEKVIRSEEAMPHRPSMPSLDYYKHVLKKDFFGEYPGVIAVHGEKWQRFRSKVQQPMLQPRTTRLYIGAIEETAESFISRIKKIRSSTDEVPNDFLNEIQKWSLESIARIALDVKLGCFDDTSKETQELIDAVNTFFSKVGILELKIPFWKIYKTPTWKMYISSLEKITEITSKHIFGALKKMQKEKRELDHNSSLVERVLAQNADHPEIAAMLALDMFLVGIDTTSAAVTSILYHLSKNPDKQEILHDSVIKVFADDSKITFKKLEQMSYLRACIKETLRLCPVVIGNGRLLTKDTNILGYTIPKGVQIIFQHYEISNSEEHFDSPNEFKPERWLKSNTSYHPFLSLPFGYGKRMCLGKRFADLELQILLAKMVKTYKISHRTNQLIYKVQPLYMPAGPLNFIFNCRRKETDPYKGVMDI